MGRFSHEHNEVLLAYIYKVNSTEWFSFLLHVELAMKFFFNLSLISRNSPETLPSAVSKASALIGS